MNLGKLDLSKKLSRRQYDEQIAKEQLVPGAGPRRVLDRTLDLQPAKHHAGLAVGLGERILKPARARA